MSKPIEASIVVVDDEPSIRELLVASLHFAGFDVATAASGSEAIEVIEKTQPDLIVLDIMLPDIDGFTVTRRIRQEGIGAPVLFLTARDDTQDKVMGLTVGGDDYVTKPFSLAVLRARVNRLLRRGSAPAATLELGPFSFDFERLRFMRNGTEVELSKTEQRLLRLLVEHRGQTLTREQLLDRVWDGGEFVDANALSVAVKRLRDKLTDAPIKTVYGLGYTWEEKR